ncbi:MAG: alkaline phosphatase D family protein [Bacteroidetes bacterium]|nr:alkaline phosphatase D family protein [Bacteroidota bacterium]
MKKLMLTILAALFFISSNAQSIVSGPMLGYAEHTENLIWLQVKDVQQVSVKYTEQGKSEWNELALSATNFKETQILKFVLTGLRMGTNYQYKILLDGKEMTFNYPLTFKTKKLWEWRTEAPDFSFLLGSCNYVNDTAFDRPGKPYGQGTNILNYMAESGADFMVWLGDNTYTREADFSSESGMKYRYQHTRGDKNLQKLLASMNHYATWDDHDYGDNDANKHFWFKDISRKLFIDYWGNKIAGQNGEGIYHNFKWSDAEFFMLDDRWFRDESELDEKINLKTQLGTKQLDWLKQSLAHSSAVFKFIVVGGQFLNTETDKESFNLYIKERAEILKFITNNKINGVVFLSGDRHHTELLKYNIKYDDKDVVGFKTTGILNYPLYDLTSSPISAGISNILKTKEATNPLRVENTLMVDNNYCGIKISGKKGQRLLTISCYDKTGIVKWGYTINENELKVKLK